VLFVCWVTKCIHTTSHYSHKPYQTSCVNSDSYNNVCMHACMHTYIHTFIHTHRHTYIHTYIRTYFIKHTLCMNIQYMHRHIHVHNYSTHTNIHRNYKKMLTGLGNGWATLLTVWYCETFLDVELLTTDGTLPVV